MTTCADALRLPDTMSGGAMSAPRTPLGHLIEQFLDTHGRAENYSTIAERAGMSRQHIRSLHRGERGANADIDTLRKLARGLNLPSRVVFRAVGVGDDEMGVEAMHEDDVRVLAALLREMNAERRELMLRRARLLLDEQLGEQDYASNDV